jgi:ubiquitin C-terminal hydrolase
MGEFVKQGLIDNINGTLLYTGGTGGALTKVLVLTFNNPSAYIITLKRFDANSATSIVLYTLSLDAGDTLNDTLNYALNVGDTLTIYSDIADTSYYIFGIDYETN